MKSIILKSVIATMALSFEVTPAFSIESIEQGDGGIVSEPAPTCEALAKEVLRYRSKLKLLEGKLQQCNQNCYDEMGPMEDVFACVNSCISSLDPKIREVQDLLLRAYKKYFDCMNPSAPISSNPG